MKALAKSSEIMDTGEPPSPATASTAPSVDDVDSHLLQPHSSTTSRTIDDGSQEVLGLVTHDTTISSGDKCSPIQLRTSARVSKKLKLHDSQNLPSTSATAATERKVEVKSQEEKNTDAGTTKSTTVRRVHELWSTEDKNAFFEALNEYGKDFDAIQTHMNHKRKKRGINQNISKNRDQARHFYYRTWHKISKYLKFPQELKKAVREQYGLINFGEFRKKIGFVSEKNSVKLNELIYSGNTQVRIKGKTVRIKTPVCRALRKLNQLQETTADVKLPSRIAIELRPRNNEAWCHVHSLAMNPRVRTYLSPHQPLRSLIRHLQLKWRSCPATTTTKEKLSCAGIEENIGETAYSCRIQGDTNIILRVAPKLGVSIVPPSVKSSEFVTSSYISLMAYEEKFGIRRNVDVEDLKRLNNSNKTSVKSNRNLKKVTNDDDKCSNSTETGENRGSNELLHPESETIPTILCPNENETYYGGATSSKDGNEDLEWTSPTKDDSMESDSEMNVAQNKELIIEKAKAGWTESSSDLVRIGDLYLMFGTDSKLQLDYWWDCDDGVNVEDESNTLQRRVSSTSPSHLSVSHTYAKRRKLSQSFCTLISIAKLYSSNKKERCSCGNSGNNKFIAAARNRVSASSAKLKNLCNAASTATAAGDNFDRTLSSGVPQSSETSIVSSKSNIANISNVNAFSTSISGNNTTGSRVNPIFCNTPRTVGSFKQQLNLQYYNRRRSGDKQRTITPLSKLTVQVIKPKEDVTNVGATTHNDPIYSESLRENRNVSNNSGGETVNIVPNLGVFTGSIDRDTTGEISTTTAAHITLTSVVDSGCESGGNELNANLLLTDEDSKSSCSTITRFLKQALPEVISTAANSSPNGLCTPIISCIEDGLNCGIVGINNNELRASSPPWSLSEASSFSVGKMFAQFDGFDKPATPRIVSTPSISGEEETRFSVDVETQFQRLINESSVDYTEKFANLAAQIASETKNTKT